MGVKWTEEQQQVIDLRDHNILVVSSRWLRENCCSGGADYCEADKGCKSGGCRPYADRDLH